MRCSANGLSCSGACCAGASDEIAVNSTLTDLVNNQDTHKNANDKAVTLTVSQLPAHTHGVNASSAATTGDPAGAVPAAGSVKQFSTQAPDQTMNPAQVTSSGGQPHDNMPPFLAISFIISLFGVFPSQT